MEKENKPKLEPLEKAVIKKIVSDLKKEHTRRYGVKMKKDGMGYEPRLKSYKNEHVYDDLEFVLNHLHLD